MLDEFNFVWIEELVYVIDYYGYVVVCVVVIMLV